MAEGASKAAAHEPRPPALLTAAASAGGEAPFIGPCTMGWAIPTADWNWVVCIVAPSLRNRVGQILTNGRAWGVRSAQVRICHRCKVSFANKFLATVDVKDGS
jgi:hypothetical protein